MCEYHQMSECPAHVQSLWAVLAWCWLCFCVQGVWLHAGSEDSTNLALNRHQVLPAPLPRAPQAFPLLSYADLGVPPINLSPSSHLEIMPLSSGLATDALEDLQAAIHPQASQQCPAWPSHTHPAL